MAENLLQCDGVSKSFFGVTVLREVSFALPKGHICGLVGENGAGKSTLMNILGGVIAADSGNMTLGQSAYAPKNPGDAATHGIAFIHQELNLFNNLSIAENLCISAMPRRRILGIPFIDRNAMRSKAAELLAAVDLPINPGTLVENLSPGERQLVEIAKALGADAKLIIFDEPTTSLTSREAERLFALIERLRQQGITMIYISHTLADVMRLCDQIIILRDGQVVGDGPRDGFTLSKMISLMVGRTIEQLYPRRDEGRGTGDEGENVETSKSQKVETAEDLRLEATGLRSMDPAVSSLKSQASSLSRDAALEVHRLSQSGVIANINFILHKGEVLGIAGLMGSGRSELARILFGLDSCEQGDIILNGVPATRLRPRHSIRNGLAFLTENRREEGLLMEGNITENIALVSLPSFTARTYPLLDRRNMRQAVAEGASRVRLNCASLDRQSAKTLSGGNQQKTVLAKWLLTVPAVLILDEPTRGIDIGAKQEIYALINELAAQGAAILFISSEIEELIGMCDRIIVMSKGEIKEILARQDFDREEILRLALDGSTTP